MGEAIKAADRLSDLFDFSELESGMLKRERLDLPPPLPATGRSSDQP